jgi:hypothetical protein
VISKIVLLFLVGMGVLAMFGKFTFPGKKQLDARRCDQCGRFKIGKGSCPCQNKKG